MKAGSMPSNVKRSVSFRAHKDDEAELRTEMYLGREHLIVPVVALVEGVLQGMTAATPELALASEFGKVPEGWNGRPVVMNHPVIDGVPVSANSPAVLEQYSFGQLFNSRLDGTKLKADAWIDLGRVKELGGEVEEIVDLIQKGSVIEVSTGLFASTEEARGTYNGKEYFGIWRDVVPDHLAFLSVGVKGACSVEDGCGTPRVNGAAMRANSNVWQEYSMSTNKEHDHGNSPKVNRGDCGCGCGGACKGTKLQTQEEIAAQSEAFQRLTANAVPEGLIDRDVHKLLQDAIRKATGRSSYAWVVGFTSGKVVYGVSDPITGDWAYYQRSYDISAERTVTLGDDIEQVNLLTEIVPVNNSESAGVSVNQESTTMPDDPKTNTTASEVVDNTEAANTPNDQEATPASTSEDESNTQKKSTKKAPAMDTNENSSEVHANSAPKVKTMAEYLSEMPAEMRAVFESGLKMHRQKKAELIKTLQESGRCKFSNEQLQSFDLDMLENLVELAAVPTYEGTATPRVNAASDDSIPMPPALFPVQ